MRRTAPLALAGLLLLTGCASTPDEPEATMPPAETLPDGCLELSPGALQSLQEGLDEKGAGYTIETAAAVLNDDAWYVAADLTGDPEVTATWMTVNDPTADGSNAYLSVTELAALVSTYHSPGNLAGSDPVNAAEACLP